MTAAIARAPHAGAVHSAHPTIKHEESAKLQQDISAWEKAGGKIEKLAFGAKSNRDDTHSPRKNRQQMSAAERHRASQQRLAERRLHEQADQVDEELEAEAADEGELEDG